MLKKTFVIFLSCALFSSMPVSYYGKVLENMGYNPKKEPAEIVEITIPENWGKVYENYNELQKQGGFDLEKYKGEVCIRYTYEMKDMPARGNIIVKDDQIIGGDVCSITLDGIMLPLEKDKIK